MREGDDLAIAAQQGGFAAGDHILGGALATYDERRKTGDNRLEAIARSVLVGIDTRIFAGIGQAIKDHYENTKDLKTTRTRSMAGMINGPIGQVRDPATAIADHGDGGAYGAKDLSKGSDPKRLDAEQKQKFLDAKSSERQHNSATAEPTSGAKGGPKGFANASVQLAAQRARNVQNVSPWAQSGSEST